MPPIPKNGPKKSNGPWDISRLWAMISIMGAIVFATIYVLTNVHDIAKGQVDRHEQRRLDIAHPKLDQRLGAIEKKLDDLRWRVEALQRKANGP